MSPNRRQVLAALAGVATAGCLQSSGTETPAATDTDAPGTATPSDRSSGATCPSFTDTDRTVCWRARADADLYLEPDTRTFRLDADDAAETIAFTLYNERDEAVTLNPYGWSVERRSDGGWTRVAPGARPLPLVELGAGGTYRWVVSTQRHPTPQSERTQYPTVDLQAGRHAFAVTVGLGGFGFEEPSPTPVDQQTTVECVALFDVVAATDGTPTPE